MNWAKSISKTLTLYSFHKSLKTLPHADKSLLQAKAATSESFEAIALVAAPYENHLSHLAQN